jgi:hypothetical protein
VYFCHKEWLPREHSLLTCLLDSAVSRHGEKLAYGQMPLRGPWGIKLAEDRLHIATLVDNLRTPEAFLGRLLLPEYSRLTLEDAVTLQRLTHMAYEYNMLGAT